MWSPYWTDVLHHPVQPFHIELLTTRRIVSLLFAPPSSCFLSYTCALLQEMGGTLKDMEAQVAELSKELVKATAACTNKADSREAEEKTLTAARKALAEVRHGRRPTLHSVLPTEQQIFFISLSIILSIIHYPE